MADNMIAKRGVVLEVPYAEKDEAKKLGAWWDPDIKKWFVPKGLDPAPFVRWTNRSAGSSKRES